VRLTSVFGPGQVAWEGATGALAAFAARAVAGEPIVIPGDPSRTRDFVYVDDLVDGLERLVSGGGLRDEPLVAGSGVATSLAHAAELARAAAGSDSPVELPGGTLPPGEDASYALDPRAPRLGFDARPLDETVPLYVDWLRRHAAAQGRA
jgi:UDP-glucose 4-epimerase